MAVATIIARAFDAINLRLPSLLLSIWSGCGPCGLLRLQLDRLFWRAASDHLQPEVLVSFACSGYGGALYARTGPFRAGDTVLGRISVVNAVGTNNQAGYHGGVALRRIGAFNDGGTFSSAITVTNVTATSNVAGRE